MQQGKVNVRICDSIELDYVRVELEACQCSIFHSEITPLLSYFVLKRRGNSIAEERSFTPEGVQTLCQPLKEKVFQRIWFNNSNLIFFYIPNIFFRAQRHLLTILRHFFSKT